MARIEEFEADALDDLEQIAFIWNDLATRLDNMHHRNVTYCDAGNVAEILDLIEQLKPHDPKIVAARARQIAWDQEGC